MHLYLSSGTPWNSTYSTEEGQVIYKIESGLPTIGARRMKISRVVPSTNPHVDDADALRDSFAHVAEVEYHSFRTSKIRYGDQELPVNEFFRKGGLSAFGRNRIFTGPDGKEYLWKLTTRVCKLFLNDRSETPIACYHRRRIGFLRKARPASLEIYPAGEHMPDMILFTFVYLEKLRKERERSSRSNGGGGP